MLVHWPWALAPREPSYDSGLEDAAAEARGGAAFDRAWRRPEEQQQGIRAGFDRAATPELCAKLLLPGVMQLLRKAP